MGRDRERLRQLKVVSPDPWDSNAQPSIPNSQEGLSPVPHPHLSPLMSSLLVALTEGPVSKSWSCYHSHPAEQGCCAHFLTLTRPVQGLACVRG